MDITQTDLAVEAFLAGTLVDRPGRLH
jgi:hypothetical protein